MDAGVTVGFGGAALSFQLDVRTYDRLRAPNPMLPSILVVYEVPAEAADWLAVTPDQTVLRKAGYWIDLTGGPAVTTDSVAVRIPATNLFDDGALRGMLAGARNRWLGGAG